MAKGPSHSPMLRKSVTTSGRPAPSPRESDDAKLEDEINLFHLKMLMETFQQADENGSNGLDVDEFCLAFGDILGKGKNRQQMNFMFMKIDSNCDGTIDWDEFCTYMLLQYQEKDGMGSTDRDKPFPRPLRIIQSPHHDVVSCICWLQNTRRVGGDGPIEEHKMKDGRYVMVSKEGTACFWNSDMVLQKTVTLDYPTHKKMWVTDCIALSNVNKIAIATTDHDLCFYDLSAGLCERQFHVTTLPGAIQHMDYWFDLLIPNHSILTFGDTGGNVGAFTFHKATQGLFAAKKQENCIRIPFIELLKGKRSVLCTAVLFEKVHSDWTKKVMYSRALDSFISCSCDSDAAIVLGHMHSTIGRTQFKIPKGVNSFDYSEDWNCIVTGGIDRIIRMWSPHVVSKPTAVLKGHNVAITHIIICKKRAHIYSISKDKMVKVWDLRGQLCIQTMSRFQSLGPAPISGLFFNEHNRTIVIAASQIGVLDGNSCDHSDGHITSHDKPIRVALYNENFSQVVSGCAGAVVCVWDVETGEKVIQFSRLHGDAEITAMAFDPTGRRLITSGQDGTVKLWNFNNGACLGQLDSPDKTEITSIVCPRGRICTAGWSRRVVVHRDVRDGQLDIPPRMWQIVHNEDILCMSLCGSSLLATASYDGDILIWSLDMETIYCQLNANGTSETIMGGPMPGKATLHSFIRIRSFMETQFMPNEEKPSKMKVVFLKKNASRRYSVAADLVCTKNENNKDKHKPQPFQSKNLQESTDISRLLQSAGEVALHGRGRLRKRASVQIPASERNISGGVEVEYGNKSTVNDKQSSETSFYLQQNSRAIEQILFLEARLQDSDTAVVVAAGAGGWVRFWNIYGSGLQGEYLGLHHDHPDFSSVSALATDPDNILLYTGCSQGYIKVWDISDYCISSSAQKQSCNPRKLSLYVRLLICKIAYKNSKTPLDRLVAKPKLTSKFKQPPILCSWHAHVRSVTSLSYNKERECLVTASADCTVRLWTGCGRYIGTFGQKTVWRIPTVSASTSTPMPEGIPKDVDHIASEYTLKTVSGPYATRSQWVLARNILKTIHAMGLSNSRREHFGTEQSGTNGAFLDKQTNDDHEQLKMQNMQAFVDMRKCQTRVKKSYQLPKLRHDGFGNFVIYPELHIAELEDVKMPHTGTTGTSLTSIVQSLWFPKGLDASRVAKNRCGALKSLVQRSTYKGKSKPKFNEHNLFNIPTAKEAK
ncbi:WD repeat-containing protein on Y chromosome-like isoform X2 [Corticium candelabrum]|nr:WD repeat-containing protein on Y chromosome-like isoform X2 [Corticium candelabrum]